LRIGIIKEKDCAQDRTLSHTLRPYQMYVPIQLHFRVTDSGTVYKYYFIEISHLRSLY
jgi:hypothetical protein